MLYYLSEVMIPLYVSGVKQIFKFNLNSTKKIGKLIPILTIWRIHQLEISSTVFIWGKQEEEVSKW